MNTPGYLSGDVTSIGLVTTVGQINGATLGTTTATSGNILVANGSSAWTSVAMSGNVTISNSGVTTIGSGVVTNAMLAGSIDTAKTNAVSRIVPGNGILISANGKTDSVYVSLTTAELYLQADVNLTANTWAPLDSVNLDAGTWLITSEVTINVTTASAYVNAFAALGIGTSATPTTVYTSGEGSTMANSAIGNGSPIQISLSKIITLGSTTYVKTYGTANDAGCVAKTSTPDNNVTSNTATGIHAIRIK